MGGRTHAKGESVSKNHEVYNSNTQQASLLCYQKSALIYRLEQSSQQLEKKYLLRLMPNQQKCHLHSYS